MTPTKVVYKTDEAYGYRFEVHLVEPVIAGAAAEYVVLRMQLRGSDVAGVQVSWRTSSLERAKGAADRAVDALRACHSEKLTALSSS